MVITEGAVFLLITSVSFTETLTWKFVRDAIKNICVILTLKIPCMSRPTIKPDGSATMEIARATF